MITVKSETTVDDFGAWSGGKDTLEDVRNADKMDELESLAEEMFPDGCTDTELNDWLWFDRDSIYESLGLTEDGELPPVEIDVEIEGVELEEEDDFGSDYLYDLIDEKLYDKIKKRPDFFMFDETFRHDNGTGTADCKFHVHDIEW